MAKGQAVFVFALAELRVGIWSWEGDVRTSSIVDTSSVFEGVTMQEGWRCAFCCVK
jgi:hypothetical protein